MNEKITSPAGRTPLAAATQPADKPAAVSGDVAAVPVAAKTVGQPVPPPAQPPSMFGGHRGGGKKREDGLVAGSPEAKAADRKKDADRKKAERDKKKVAELPPTLPGVPSSASGSTAALVDGKPAVPAAVASVASDPALAVFPMFVPWTEKLVGRVSKIATKIADRLRVASVMKRVRKLGFGKELESEAEKRIAYKEEKISDFNAALTNCLVIEGNKRRVPGAEHSHWLELGLVGGELINDHLDTVDWLEKQILAKAERDKPAEQKL